MERPLKVKNLAARQLDQPFFENNKNEVVPSGLYSMSLTRAFQLTLNPWMKWDTPALHTEVEQRQKFHKQMPLWAADCSGITPSQYCRTIALKAVPVLFEQP